MSNYPEHDKMATVRPQIDAVTEFLEGVYAGELQWQGQPLHLATGTTHSQFGGEPGSAGLSHRCDPFIGDLLAQHFGIDRRQLEAEKIQMLAACRATNVEADR
jgi:hypothetical protein